MNVVWTWCPSSLGAGWVLVILCQCLEQGQVQDQGQGQGLEQGQGQEQGQGLGLGAVVWGVCQGGWRGGLPPDSGWQREGGLVLWQGVGTGSWATGRFQ